MKKYKELIKNVGVLTLSNFGSKILSFLLVPLYTSVLTTEEFGNFDFVTTTISLLIPLLTINITEAALRFLLDKKNNEKDIFAICTKIILLSIILISIISIINNFFNIVPILKEYYLYFIIYYIISVIYQFAQNFTRGLDKLNNIAIGGILNSILMLSLNLIFLLLLNMRLDGYFLANIIANAISAIYLLTSTHVEKYVTFRKYDKKLKKQMIGYSKPLMVNSIGWWINNVSDRYIVTYICGAAANGVYSVAYKIPSILSIVQTIFNQAWTISAVKTFNKEDNDNFFKNIYTLYNFVMVLSCSILISVTKILARVLYKNEFYIAWEYMPFLMISIVFSALSGLLGGIFSAAKDSKVMSISTIIGAIINIILNFILIYFFGVIGAAVATAFSCFIVWLIRIKESRKYVDIRINIKIDIIVYGLLLLQAIVFLLIKNNMILYIMQILCICTEIIIYKNEIKKGYYRLKEKSKIRREN